MLAALRKLGLNLQIERAQLTLLSDFVVTESGVPLSAEQAKLLVHLGLKLVKFRATVLCRWSRGTFEEIEA
jgi:mRNA turnover protein 4